MSRHIVKKHFWVPSLGVMDVEEVHFDNWAAAKEFAESQSGIDSLKIYDGYGQLVHTIHNTPENTYA